MALVTCPKCGTLVSNKAAACPVCGMPVADILAELNGEAKSAPVTQPEQPAAEPVSPAAQPASPAAQPAAEPVPPAPPAPAPSTEEPPKRSGSIPQSTLIIIISAVALLFLLLLVIIFLLVRKPSTATGNVTSAPQVENLSTSAQPQQSYTSSSAAQSYYDIYACAYDGFVWICSAPTTKSTWLRKFWNGSHGATILGYSNGWTQINYDGTVGWVASQYTSNTPTKEVSVDLSDSWQVGWWTDGMTDILVFDNGTWECAGEVFIFSRGTYIVEGDAINFKPVQYFYDHGPEKIAPGKLTINKNSGRLGTYYKATFSAPGDYGAGTYTKDQFKSMSKRVYNDVKRAQGGRLRF